MSEQDAIAFMSMILDMVEHAVEAWAAGNMEPLEDLSRFTKVMDGFLLQTFSADGLDNIGKLAARILSG